MTLKSMIIRIRFPVDLSHDRHSNSGSTSPFQLRISYSSSASTLSGCRSILIDLHTEGQPDSPERPPDYVAADLMEAASYLLSALRGGGLSLAPPAVTREGRT